MALIDLSSGRVQAFRDTMRHQNSVFHAVVKHISWQEFDRSVATHGANARVRRLTTKSQFVALLFGQLSGAAHSSRAAPQVGGHRVSD